VRFGLVGIAACAAAHVQLVIHGPDGSMGISNGNGTYTYIYPDRFNPWTNQAVPGSHQMMPWERIYLGLDGKPHAKSPVHRVGIQPGHHQQRKPAQIGPQRLESALAARVRPLQRIHHSFQVVPRHGIGSQARFSRGDRLGLG
jgi:hypothetical protein